MSRCPGHECPAFASEGLALITTCLRTLPPSPTVTPVWKRGKTFPRTAGGSLVWHHRSGRQFEAILYVKSCKNVHISVWLVRTGDVMLQGQSNPGTPVVSHWRLVCLHTTHPGRRAGGGWWGPGGCSAESLRYTGWHSPCPGDTSICEGTGTGELHVGVSQARPAGPTCHSAQVSLARTSHETLNDSKGRHSGVTCVHRKARRGRGTWAAPDTFEAASPMAEKFPK